MDRKAAQTLIENTFNYPFDENRFRYFAINLLTNLDKEKDSPYISGKYIKDFFREHVHKYRRIGTYIAPDGDKLDVLVVHLVKPWALERAWTMLRNFTAWYLKNQDEKDAALVAYHTDDLDDWRFSFVRMEYRQEITEKGTIKVKEEFTPARRYSYLVGKNEPNHTAQEQMIPVLENDQENPTLADIEAAFSVDAVTKQFYKDYRALFEKLTNELNNILEKDNKIKKEFEDKSIDTANFSKKLMGQIVFLYFLQKKGWLGVSKDNQGDFKRWGTGPKNFMKRLLNREFSDYKNFFNDILEPLFYNALNNGDRHSDYYEKLDCKIPFLDGGLFDPMNDYDWVETEIRFDNEIFAEILKTFDRYNFTVREDEPLDKEVAVDPEMLGQVFENLLPENLRKGKGTYFTPRTIVHYMCQESLINYLVAECEGIIPEEDIIKLVRKGESAIEVEAAIKDGTKSYTRQIPESIRQNAMLINQKLADIKVCDPAVGSGAFLVTMMNEIIKIRHVLNTYLKLRNTSYEYKWHCIQESLYGVDIDPGAIEIAKLRLWLSLVVDEHDYRTIQPLPNLDFKIMQGNSLIEDFCGIYLGVKKKQEQLKLGGDIEKLDQLVKLLYQKQEKFFNAIHPKEKLRYRRDVEDAIFRIFHHQMEKKREFSLKEAQEIEVELIEMTRGNKPRNFFPWKLYFANIFRDKGGFDIVIANPPYIEFKKLDPAMKEAFQNYSSAKGKYDIYIIFLEKNKDLIHGRGHIAYICPTMFMMRDYGKALRKFIVNNYIINKIHDFGDIQIFNSAMNYTGLFFMSGDETSTQEHFQYYKYESFPANKIKEIFTSSSISENFSKYSKISKVNKNYLKNEIWNFQSQEHESLLNKISCDSKTLGDYSIIIYEGIASGKDEVFYLSEKQIDDLFIETDIIFPLVKGKDIKRYKINWSKNYVLYPYKKSGEVFKESELKEKYPNLYNYLCKKKELLTGRGYFEKSNKLWYELWCQRNQNILKSKKILVPEISQRNNFAFDNHIFFGNTKVYHILLKDDSITNYYYILGLLNSRLIEFWYKKNTVPKAGGFFAYKTQFLKCIPIKFIKERSKLQIIQFVSKIMSLDSSNFIRDISLLETKIDNLVYEIYGLTTEEIAIVEDNIT